MKSPYLLRILACKWKKKHEENSGFNENHTDMHFIVDRG